MLKKANDAVINKSIDAVYNMSSSEKTRELVRMREKAMHDKVSELYEAEMRGIDKGTTLGMEKLIAGMRMTGLSEEQIQAAIRAANSQGSV